MVPQDGVFTQKASSFSDYFNLSSIDNLNSIENDTLSSAQKMPNEWGPIRDPLYIVIPITVIYSLIFITGVIGNVSTCIVISRIKSMHTATNYYLFSLAVSDLLLLISGLPTEIYTVWSKYPYIFGEPFCILQGFAAETSANATVLTITAFTVERYMAICHPFLSHTMSKLSRAIKFIMAIWLLAICLAVPQAMSQGLVYQVTQDGKLDYNYYVCGFKRIIIPHTFELSTLVFFVAPMSLISVLYVLIALQLRRSRIVRRDSLTQSVELKHRVSKTSHSGQPLQSVVVTEDGTAILANRPSTITTADEKQPTSSFINCREDGRKNYHRNMHSKATKRVVNMLIAVVVAFFICWAPFHAQRLLAIHGDIKTPEIIAVYRFLTYSSGVLYYLSTCINPLLYNIMSNKFRNAFKEILSRYITGRRSRTPARRYSALSLPRSVSPTRSQSLSQSGGHSRNASLRKGRDSDMAIRPLVVSFRRPRTHIPTTCIHAPRCTCRIPYHSKQIEETSLNVKEATSFNQPTKGKLFKKWGKKKSPVKTANISCKVICSECHRYLSSDPEVQSKHSTTNENSVSSNNDEYKNKNGEESTRLSMINSIPMSETDLIPHHRCPNRNNMPASTIIQNIPNGHITEIQCGVTQSKTMPDIVKYTLQNNKESKRTHVETNNKPVKNIILEEESSRAHSDVIKEEDIKDTPKSSRKWGSAEMLSSKTT